MDSVQLHRPLNRLIVEYPHPQFCEPSYLPPGVWEMVRFLLWDLFHISSLQSEILSCAVSCLHFFIRYKWTKNGEAVIVNDYVRYDSTSGNLTIPSFFSREEGTYMCIASNVFDNEVGRVTASSFAPPIKLFQTSKCNL